jgi:RING-box protein 1
MEDVVTIESWHPCGVWGYKVETDDCAICKNKLCEICASCIDNAHILEQKCNISKGICGHVYHTHCITKWLTQSQSCPIDTAPWKYDIKE